MIQKTTVLAIKQHEGTIMGFTCKACGTPTFILKVQPSVEQQLHITTNEFEDVLITVGNNPPFQADLGFMNRFASCSNCGAIKQWHYKQTHLTEKTITADVTTVIKPLRKKPIKSSSDSL